MIFFHVSPTDHPIGTLLQTGRFGAQIRSARIHQTPVDVHLLKNLVWESTLEVARRLSAPGAPSRLDCVFATPSFAEAHQFRQRYRQGAYIFEIEVPDNTPIHAADFEIITTMPAGKPFVDGYIDSSLIYWTGAQSSKLREVLVGGPAMVKAKMP